MAVGGVFGRTWVLASFDECFGVFLHGSCGVLDESRGRRQSWGRVCMAC